MSSFQPITSCCSCVLRNIRLLNCGSNSLTVQTGYVHCEYTQRKLNEVYNPERPLNIRQKLNHIHHSTLFYLSCEHVKLGKCSSETYML